MLCIGTEATITTEAVRRRPFDPPQPSEIGTHESLASTQRSNSLRTSPRPNSCDVHALFELRLSLARLGPSHVYNSSQPS